LLGSFLAYPAIASSADLCAQAGLLMTGEPLTFCGQPLLVAPKRRAADYGNRRTEPAVGPHTIDLAIGTLPQLSQSPTGPALRMICAAISMSHTAVVLLSVKNRTTVGAQHALVIWQVWLAKLAKRAKPGLLIPA
jgi:hypothetical protein